MSESLELRVEGDIATLTLNRPQARNAIDDAMRESLRKTLSDISDDPEISVVILTGAGTAFCAGGDVKAMGERLKAGPGKVAIQSWRRQRRTAAMTSALHELNQITVAAVNGPAVGLGLDLALACDFIIAGSDASFRASYVKRGLIPDGGGLYFLPRRVGLQQAKSMMYTGRPVGADEALRIGLADRLASSEDLLEQAHAYAREFTGNSRSAITLTKSIVNRSFELSFQSVAALGGEAQAMSYTSEEHQQSVAPKADK